MYSIRRVTEMTEEVADEIRDMQFFCFGEGFGMEYDPESGHVNHHWWLAYHDNEPAAVAFAAIVPSVIVKDYAFLMRSGVLKDHRGHGLQRRLVGVRERYARRLGFWGLVSYTIENPHSANNLIKAGMKMYTPAWDFAGPGACYWRKDFAL